VYIAHGTRDAVFPIDASSRLLVPYLRELGYQVSYSEFEGGHELPAAVAADAVEWCARGA
jgi:predicted esterase